MVGAGVIGLSCAVRLLEQGHRVDVLARDLPLETTSAVAAALWYPYRAYPYERVTAWSSATFAELQRLSHDDATGVRMLKGTELHRAATADPWWMSAVPTLTRVSTMPAPYVDGWTFEAPVAEMPVYLRWLASRVEELGGTLTRMALGALPDGTGAEVVVDATGLGARLMAADPTPAPDPRPGGARRAGGPGPLVARLGRSRLRRPAQPRRRRGRHRRRGRVGPHDPTPTSPSRSSSGPPSWCRSWPARGCSATGSACVRRGRRSGSRRSGGGTTRVVHCYGHGGAGVTLSWGCADEVAALVSA